MWGLGTSVVSEKSVRKIFVVRPEKKKDKVCVRILCNETVLNVQLSYLSLRVVPFRPTDEKWNS